MKKQILSCDLHDYLEIACMYSMPITLTLKDGTEHIGVATTIKSNRTLGEYLVFSVAKHIGDMNNKEKTVATNVQQDPLLIPVLSLYSMQAMQTNPHFEKVTFSHTDK